MNDNALIRQMKRTGAHAGRGADGEIGICEMTTDEHFETASRFREPIGIGSLTEDLTVRRIRLLQNAHVVSFNIAGEIHDPEIVAAISELPCLEELMCRMKGRHVREMCASLGRSVQLKELHAAQSDIDDASAAHLASLTSLRELDLSDTKLRESLAFTRCMTELCNISLDGVEISMPAIEELTQIASLTDLYLARNRLPGAAACLIKKLHTLQSLAFVQESQGEPFEVISQLCSLHQLRYLSISSWMLTPSAINELSSMTMLKDLMIHSIAHDDPRLKLISTRYPSISILDLPR